MDRSLKRLIDVMPPPVTPRAAVVDWDRVETSIGLKYPKTFKEFVSTYGASVWCDHFSPFYTSGNSDQDVKKFGESIAKKLNPLRGNLYDAKSKKIEMPLYPEPNGLFPFMIDYSGSLYCWRTEGSKSDQWPIVCWFTGQIAELESMSISRMLLEWLEREPTMVSILGDAGDLPPERLRLS